MSEVAVRYGVSRQAVYTWMAKHKAGEVDALREASRRPKSSPTRVPAEVEALACEMRRAHPRWGARRISFELAQAGVASPPSRATVHRVLARNGLVRLCVPKTTSMQAKRHSDSRGRGCRSGPKTTLRAPAARHPIRRPIVAVSRMPTYWDRSSHPSNAHDRTRRSTDSFTVASTLERELGERTRARRWPWIQLGVKGSQVRILSSRRSAEPRRSRRKARSAGLLSVTTTSPS